MLKVFCNHLLSTKVNRNPTTTSVAGAISTHPKFECKFCANKNFIVGG